MKYGSLFSGIEAASLAFRPLGWTCAWVAEIDPFCRALLRHHYPDTPNLGDVTKVDWDAVEPVDVIVGGSPCQSFSVAGRRLGLDDPRGNLALVYLDVVRRVRPRWMVFENVPGLLSSDEGRDFGTFLGLLGQLGFGFSWRILDAQHGGVPQRRRRLWVVGHSGGQWQRAAAVLFDEQSLHGDPPPGRQAGEGVAGTIAASAGGSDENDAKDGRLITHSLTAEGFDASEDGTGRGSPLVPVSFTGGASDCISAEDLAQPARCDASRRVTGRNGDPGMIAFDILGTPATQGGRATDIHTALRSRAPGASEASTTTVAMTASGVRRLLPVECERLMAMPDDYTLVPYRGKPAADGNRYKAIGNSMVVSEVRWIGERIELVDEI